MWQANDLLKIKGSCGSKRVVAEIAMAEGGRNEFERILYSAAEELILRRESYQ